MESSPKFLVDLDDAADEGVKSIGAKAKNLAICKREGFSVPDGFCLTTDSYNLFVLENRLDSYVDWEMTRKPFEELRWEEIWDSSLRIRLYFLKGKLPEIIESNLKSFLSQYDEDTLFSIRSSAPDEDSKEFSFAGIHESFINVSGESEIIDKIKLVWASLWSDRSLLYKNENALDSLKSSMAVIVQTMKSSDISGLTFTKNPSNMDETEMVIETVYGSLEGLVSNKESPDRIILNKNSGDIKKHISKNSEKKLSDKAIKYLYRKSLELENIFEIPIDIEWTGLYDEFTVLQVRPITSKREDPDTDRKWYLTLTPSGENLLDLSEKVESELIPKLYSEGEKLSKLSPSSLSEEDFLEEFKYRGNRYEYWLKVYWDDFIPLAHGIRKFGVFYNDLVSPDDPYEFVDLLRAQSLLAYERNKKMKSLAIELSDFKPLKEELWKLLDSNLSGGSLLDSLLAIEKNLQKKTSNKTELGFIERFLEFIEGEMNVVYNNKKLESSPEIILRVILNLSEKLESEENANTDSLNLNELSQKYFKAAEEKDLVDESRKWLMVGRVSWKLRDDDNILLSRIENQLLKFIESGIERLKSKNIKVNIPKNIILSDWNSVYDSLKSNKDLSISRSNSVDNGTDMEGITSRQLMGQPSSSGSYTGRARIINSFEDFKDVKSGEVLVFDAVEPQMTFIISLAGAIIERRGGMLVHSSIIAREMNIPAVNGVTDATKLIKTGDTVTVNGDLGVVVIGGPDFEI